MQELLAALEQIGLNVSTAVIRDALAQLDARLAALEKPASSAE
jgi:uncharacterized protein (DUF2164 family)